MKKFIPLVIFTTFSAFAQVSQVEIKNFSFQYTAPHGEGSAETFNYQQKVDAAQKVSIDKNGSDFLIQLEGVENREFEFKNAPDLLVSAQTIDLKNFNLGFAEKLSISANSASFLSPEKELELKSFNLNCDKAAGPELMDQVIAGCFQKMTVKAGGISSASEITAIFTAFDESHNEYKDGVGVKNLDLKINAGKFDLSASISAQISGTAKANGTMKYDASSKTITVKISEVKFGILNVTSKVFDELKKQESANLRVKEPYLYIKVK